MISEVGRPGLMGLNLYVNRPEIRTGAETTTTIASIPRNDELIAALKWDPLNQLVAPNPHGW